MTRRVISISGPPGVGKSTLVNAIVEKTDATAVYYDDYEVITRWSPADVTAWLDAGAPFEEAIAPGLYERIQELDGLVVLETPFGPACPQIGPLIDGSVWLDCPLDVALARKLSALAVQGAGSHDFQGFLRGWLTAYQGFTRRALLVQLERVRPITDLQVDASGALGNYVSRVFSFINHHLTP